MALKTLTVTARVTPRVRRLVKAAAEEEGATLSRFAAEALEERARRRLLEGREQGRGDDDAGGAGPA
jgi:uncharacterized protein (DUF1778 family)